MQSTDIVAMNANAIASTFYFFADTKGNAKKNKKSLQANAPKSALPLDKQLTTDRRAACNRRLAKVAVQCSADSFVVNQSLVLRINICGENRHLRQAPNRWNSLIRMKNKLKSINNIPFLACLAILLLNDFYLKIEYHNWLTGKLSDFCGLFVFVLFWTAIIPSRKRTIYITTAISFVIWKSPDSQLFIEFFSQNFYPINRVVDVTDLIALSILPIAYYYRPNHFIKLNPLPIALLSVFSFCATSIPEPTQVFEHPHYLLFKSGITIFENSKYPSKYVVHNLDSLVIIDIKEIRIDRRASIDDEFHKVQILKDIDLRFLRESQDGFRTQNKLTDYDELRDSLIVEERTTITLKLDSIIDHLEFRRTRLDGKFKRFSNDNNLILDGIFKDGVEDSVWTFYNRENEIMYKKYFENGELIRTELFEKAKLNSEIIFNTRSDTIKNKYFHIALLGLLIAGIIFGLLQNFKKFKNKDYFKLYNFTKIVWSLLLPLPTLILAKFLSSIIPKSFTTDFFGIFGEAILVFVIVAPLYAFILYVIKLRNWIDLVYYIFFFAIGIVLLEELIYLKNII